MYPNAIKYLKYFYGLAKNKLPFNNFDEMLDHYRTDQYLLSEYNEIIKHDDFISEYESAVNIAGDYDTRASLETIASKIESGKVPSYQVFFNALSGQVSSFSYDDFKSVAKDSLIDSTKFIGGTIASALLIKVAIGLASVYLVKRFSK